MCLVLSCTMLVSCAEDKIGDYIHNYEDKTEHIERLNINMYIIVDHASDNALTSVKDRIAGHTKTTYNTVLNVFYITADDYQQTIADAIAEGGVNAPNIVLINSESMLDSLINAEGGNKLADLSNYYSSKAYGRLNSQIASALLESSKINNKFYTVPNNHVVDQYTYLVVNKEVAHLSLKTPTTVIDSYKSYADTEDLRNKMSSAGYDPNEFVYEINGPYEMKSELIAQGNFCNVIKVPTVTRTEAFASAFAIVNSTEKYNDRAMQMIYAVNNDLELRNLLQYGVEGANYIIENDNDANPDNDNIVRKTDENSVYKMNLLYTGNVFNAEYCSELGWTKTVKDNGTEQNKAAVSAQ